MQLRIGSVNCLLTVVLQVFGIKYALFKQLRFNFFIYSIFNCYVGQFNLMYNIQMTWISTDIKLKTFHNKHLEYVKCEIEQMSSTVA